jgi:hypothetical protein
MTNRGEKETFQNSVELLEACEVGFTRVMNSEREQEALLVYASAHSAFVRVRLENGEEIGWPVIEILTQIKKLD